MISSFKVLTVDDDSINLQLLGSMLKKYENVESVLKAENGLDALTILGEHPDVNLILLDIKMPIMDGMDFLVNIQSQPKLNNIPIIVLTTDETRKNEAIDKGAYDFLPKPVRREKLYEKLDTISQIFGDD